MGSMTSTSSESHSEIFNRLDDRVRHVDEERWLSSRYASPEDREALVVLYAYYFELARVRLIVTDASMAAIRFQWWRDALAGLEAGKPRQHDVVLALQDQTSKGKYRFDALQRLIDDFEDAFEAKNRFLEPEAKLAAIAAKVLVEAHSWGEAINKVAPHWAALRRDEVSDFGPIVEKAPNALRPAVAHFRLRKAWSAGKKLTPLSRRLSVLRAINSGRV